MVPARPGNALTSSDGPETSWSNRPRVVRTLSILTALGLILGILGVLLPKVLDGDDTYDADERAKVLSRASDFAATNNTYNVNDLADYQKRLKGLLTPEYNEVYVRITDAIFAAIKDKKQISADPKVRGVAIESIDEDSAVALVAVDATISNTDLKAAVLRHFRWKLSFTKTGGEWLVSNFESVASVTATAGVPSATAPTSAPTTEGGSDQ